MNFKTHVLTLLLLICCGACNPSPHNENPTDPALSTTLLDTILPPDTIPPFEIDSALAIEYIDTYQQYINAIQDTLVNNYGSEFPNPGKKLVYGAKVSLYELKAILKNVRAIAPSDDSLYVMMGIMPSDSTELIFALQFGDENRWKFFDFTMPCPNACPNYEVE